MEVSVTAQTPDQLSERYTKFEFVDLQSFLADVLITRTPIQACEAAAARALEL
ncbi:MAG: hypothetical protein U9N84_14380 [Actinomycetota bacterium]|nr:hypothetical protein [Actinomycetota bacterium]